MGHELGQDGLLATDFPGVFFCDETVDSRLTLAAAGLDARDFGGPLLIVGLAWISLPFVGAEVDGRGRAVY